MIYGSLDWRIKQDKERRAFPEPDAPAVDPRQQAQWNLTERLAQIERGELLRGMTKNDAAIVAREYYGRTIND